MFFLKMKSRQIFNTENCDSKGIDTCHVFKDKFCMSRFILITDKKEPMINRVDALLSSQEKMYRFR